MQHTEGTIAGARGATIYYQGWLPSGSTRAVLLIVHGLAEHSGRYMNVVNHFVPLGYTVYSLDHLGHGRSEGTRVFVERFTDFTETLKGYFDMVRIWQPGKPVFLLGHSLGALIGAAYLLDYQAGLAGAVLSAPPVILPASVTPLTVTVARLASVVLPKMGVQAVESGAVSRDPAVVQAYVQDPLVYTGKTTARLGAEMIAAIRRVNAEAARITLPLLIVYGTGDRLVNPTGSPLLYNAVGSTDKTIKAYQGFYHEVFNEPGREQVLGDVEKWLGARLSRQQPE